MESLKEETYNKESICRTFMENVIKQEIKQENKELYDMRYQLYYDNDIVFKEEREDNLPQLWEDTAFEDRLENMLSVCSVFKKVICLFRLQEGYLSVPSSRRLSVCSVFMKVICLFRLQEGYLSVPSSRRLSVCSVFKKVICLFRLQEGYLSVPSSRRLSVCSVFMKSKGIQLAAHRPHPALQTPQIGLRIESPTTVSLQTQYLSLQESPTPDSVSLPPRVPHSRLGISPSKSPPLQTQYLSLQESPTLDSVSLPPRVPHSRLSISPSKSPPLTMGYSSVLPCVERVNKYFSTSYNTRYNPQH
uniref:Uncharacterized protein n=1 Tax=Timema monikensis TaxID=170555 RepID=A0A7R9EJ32_9NEOP|nr:unnamed protein product [Timema monikensis]